MNTYKKDDRKIRVIFPMVVIGILFFIFGFVTWLNGSLIPFLKIICDLTTFQALYVTLVFYIAYTLMALPSSWVLSRTGYKKGMALGLLVMVIGTLLFIPAAYSANYLFFLSGLFILGTGLTILQTASNPYIVLLGPSETAATRISIMGIVNKLAGVIVPIVFSALILSDFGDTSPEALNNLTPDEIQSLSNRIVTPYLYMAGVLTFLIGLVMLAPLPEVSPELEANIDERNKGENTSILNHPQIILGSIALFFYVGVEVIAGDTIGLLGSDLSVTNFATLTSYTMVFMVLGYLIGVFGIPKYLSQKTALLLSAVAGISCTISILISDPASSNITAVLWGWSNIPILPNPVFFVALLGLANALVWPAIWPLALEGLGRLTAQGSALLIMGISGGAILPLVYGAVSDASNLQDAYWVTIPCYLFILYYALIGHKKRHW